MGAHWSCAIDDPGVASCWGNNDFAYLGSGTLTSSTAPVPIAAPEGTVFVAIDRGRP